MPCRGGGGGRENRKSVVCVGYGGVELSQRPCNWFVLNKNYYFDYFDNDIIQCSDTFLKYHTHKNNENNIFFSVCVGGDTYLVDHHGARVSTTKVIQFETALFQILACNQGEQEPGLQTFHGGCQKKTKIKIKIKN
jgi:hypothetical protein